MREPGRSPEEWPEWRSAALVVGDPAVIPRRDLEILQARIAHELGRRQDIVRVLRDHERYEGDRRKAEGRPTGEKL